MNTIKGINTRTNRTMQNNTFKKTQQKEQQHKKHNKIRTIVSKKVKKETVHYTKPNAAFIIYKFY